MLQGSGQAAQQFGERLHLIPDQGVQPDAVFQAQPGTDGQGPGPETALQFLNSGFGPEIPNQIFLEILKIIQSDPAGTADTAFQIVQSRDNGLGIRRFTVFGVRVICVGQNFDQIRFREQTHAHRMPFWQGLRPGHGEAGDQSRGLLSSLRVDLADEVVGFPAEIRQQSSPGVPGQRGDQIGLSGLAGTEHPGAHLAPRRKAATPEQPGAAPQLLLQALVLAAHHILIVLSPTHGGRGQVHHPVAARPEIRIMNHNSLRKFLRGCSPPGGEFEGRNPSAG